MKLFLREPAAPLDNNVCERALRKAIPHRKNALFEKTENAARVKDLCVTLAGNPAQGRLQGSRRDLLDGGRMNGDSQTTGSAA